MKIVCDRYMLLVKNVSIGERFIIMHPFSYDWTVGFEGDVISVNAISSLLNLNSSCPWVGLKDEDAQQG